MSQALAVETAEQFELPVIGQPFAGGFFAGEHILNGERFALIVAPKALGEKLGVEHKLNKCNTADGTDAEDDGLANSDLINDKNHPAAQFCRTLQIGEHSDWYLPSRDELMRIWMALGPNRKTTPEPFRAGAPEAFENRWYWSSTESASYSYGAWDVNFDDGYQYSTNKDFGGAVRAVRRLKI